MSRFFTIFIFALSSLVLSACSMFGSEEIDYRNSEITPTLEIPPDLIQSQNGRNLSLPGSKVGLDSNAGRYVETGNLNIESRTLPGFDGLELQGKGNLHWLSIPYSAEKIYPLVQEFWAEQGYELMLDEPVIGMMRTRWMRSKSANSSFLGKIMDRMSAAESKHQFITRLQRSADDVSTLVFIAHRQQELVLKDDEPGSSTSSKEGWQFRAADPAQEYEMLSRLMVFLGLNDEAVKTQMQKIGTFTARASIHQGDQEGVAYMQVTEGFNRTWNRLYHQLTRLNVVPEESKREQNRGDLVINAAQLYASLEESGRPERESIRLSLTGDSNSDNTRIEVLDNKGIRDRSVQAREILQSLLVLLK